MKSCLCGGKKFTEAERVIRICAKCQSILVNSDVSEVKYDEAYHDRSLVSLSFLGKLQSLYESYYFLPIVRNKDCLDYGCGEGDFYKYYKKRGINIDGYDPYYRNKKNLLRKKYDVIFCFHVIEHVDDPDNLVRILYKMLKPGGKLILRTPRADSLEFRIAGGKWFHVDFPYHKFIFSKKCLNLTLQKSGFGSIVDNRIIEFPQTLGYSLMGKNLLFGLVFIPLSVVLQLLGVSPVLNITTKKND